MEDLLTTIRNCKVCEAHLPLGARPVLSVNKHSKIAVIGQAPGTKVHKSGIPWDDLSGKLLRQWMGVTDEEFYNPDNFAIVPMGFCYPGKGAGGDMPPRKECAPLWHEKVFGYVDNLQLTLLIGAYSQKYYLGKNMKSNLTDTVRNYEEYLPDFFPMPHPSPRNLMWRRRNPWFEEGNVPHLKELVRDILESEK